MKKLTASLSLLVLLVTGTAFAAESAVADPAAPPTKEGRKMKNGKGDFDGKPRRFKFEDCDKDKDGAFSLEEFLACHPKGDKGRFDEIDANKDGKLTREEMRAWREANKAKFAEKRKERRTELFQQCDKNGDGVLSLEEFVNCPPPPKHEKGKKYHNSKPGKPGLKEVTQS